MPPDAISKVTAGHLRKDAYLYVRQSTIKQVLNNTESALRQYDLKSRAVALGWDPGQVIVIDIDQGHSGASIADREGFQKLVAEVGMGKAGIVLGLECSRLARNSADWHRLLEICALAGTLICDEDGLYDPNDFNDRMLLGWKGQLSEAELHFLRSRMRGGTLSKARRGDLAIALPAGLVYDGAGHVALDPDTAVQQAVAHLFATFAATGSAHAVVKAFHAAGLTFPHRHRAGPAKGQLDWAPLQYHTVLRVLHSPRYAGVYCYGRRRGRRGPGGTLTVTAVPRQEWIAFIPGAHPGYISVAEFDANQARLAEAAAAHGADRKAGPPREGPALCQGIIVCGRCGQRMTVRYRTRRGAGQPYYLCQRPGTEHAATTCQAVPGAGIDTAVGQLLIGALTPLAIEAALTVAAELEHRADAAGKLRAATVERARYHADAARRRYLAVDPANRLVAATLEAAWNTALREVSDAQDAYDKAASAAAAGLTDAQKARIGKLTSDFPAIWNDPATPHRERKRMARLLLTDVTVTKNDTTITCNIRLAGGQDHTLTLPRPQPAPELRKTAPHIIAAVDKLLDHHTCAETARILGDRGVLTGEGRPFSPASVEHIRRAYQLPSRHQRLAAAGLLTLSEIATRLGVSPGTVKAWHRAGIVSGQRYNDKGQMLYHPPGPGLKRPKTGRPPGRPRPAQTPNPAATTTRGAV